MEALTLTLTALLVSPLAAQEVSPIAATQKSSHVLAASAESPDRPYLAFPAVLDLGAEVLVSFKHGRSHACDVGATLDSIRLDKASGLGYF